MFDSGVSAKDFIENLKSEVDIAIPIPNASYVMWLNTIEQLLYTEYIKEQKQNWFTNEGFVDGFLKIDNLYFDKEKEEQPRFEDIHAVYGDDVQFIKTTLASRGIFPNSYSKCDDHTFGNSIFLNGYNSFGSITVIFYVKPKLKTVDKNDNIAGGNVMLPYEFLSLAAAYIRGEAYKIANEDALAAKWINDYNVLLETFKAWLDKRKSNFGV